MARHGLREGCFVYIADGALVSGENLEKLSSIRFVSRLPSTFGCCPEAIDHAVEAGTWTDLGTLAELQPSRKAASYKAFETGVTIEGRDYRAVVIHSDSHDRRRQKAIERKLETSHKELTFQLKGLQSRYYCEQVPGRLCAHSKRGKGRCTPSRQPTPRLRSTREEDLPRKVRDR